jgi:hypothetical protein
MSHNNYKYHLEMIIEELRNKVFVNSTRICLYLDRTEHQFLQEILKSELASVNRTLDNKQ